MIHPSMTVSSSWVDSEPCGECVSVHRYWTRIITVFQHMNFIIFLPFSAT
jgi:hypothetical protein